MDIKNLKRKEVRCIIEDVKDGSVVKHYGATDIKTALERYNKDRMVKIFEPTEDQKAELQQLLFQDEDDKIKATAMNIIEAMRMITDLEGLEDVTDEELIDTIQAPDRVLEEINFEINRVFTEIIKNYYEKLSVMNSLPKPLLEAHLKDEIEKAEKAQHEEEERARLRAELEAQRAEIEAKMNSLK